MGGGDNKWYDYCRNLLLNDPGISQTVFGEALRWVYYTDGGESLGSQSNALWRVRFSIHMVICLCRNWRCHRQSENSRWCDGLPSSSPSSSSSSFSFASA